MRPFYGSPAILSLLFCGCLLFSCGCIGEPREGGAHLIVVSIPPLATFVEAVGGDLVEVKILLPPGADPHTFEPTPRDLVEVSRADLFVFAGSGLPFEERLKDRWKDLQPDLPQVNASRGIPLVDRDPHIWLSPQNAQQMVETIREGLCTLDPSQCEQFSRRSEQYNDELEQLDLSLRSRLDPCSRKQFIVMHPAWGYFAREYGLTQLAIEEEGKEASAPELAHLIETARREGIRVVIMEPQFRSREAEVLAQEINGTVVQIDPLSRAYAESLDQMAEAVTRRC
jgi:zinc transport system substrate-binding protein